MYDPGKSDPGKSDPGKSDPGKSDLGTQTRELITVVMFPQLYLQAHQSLVATRANRV